MCVLRVLRVLPSFPHRPFGYAQDVDTPTPSVLI